MAAESFCSVNPFFPKGRGGGEKGNLPACRERGLRLKTKDVTSQGSGD